MNLRFAGLFADAGNLWRAERSLVLAVAGVFFWLPLLGILLLIVANPPQLPAAPDKAAEALRTFYGQFTQANLVPLAVANFAMDYGTFAILSLYLQGGGRMLGQVLALALRRLFPFLVLELLVGFALSLGLSLFVVPGLFLFARTWLAAPAYAANPKAGLLGAFQQGWVRSGGVHWLIFLLVGAALCVAGIGAMALAQAVTGLVATAFGGGAATEFFSCAVMSLVVALFLTGLTVMRVAAYRATEPRHGT